MEQLIDDIYDLIKDYRSDEDDRFRMSKQRIDQWVNQFDEDDRVFLLSELKNVFQKHYCSRDKAKKFIRDEIVEISQVLGYSNAKDFLRDSYFLDLQEKGKSQEKMIQLLEEILESDYSFDLSDCGTNQRKNFIYIDDILCTGNTLYHDIRAWVNLQYSQEKTNLQAITDKSVNLIFAYYFFHTKNYGKKIYQFKREFGATLSDKLNLFYQSEVDNYRFDSNKTLAFTLPLEEGQTSLVTDYKDAIVTQVNEYNAAHDYAASPEEFYRQTGVPKTESFFTSPESRNRFENIMLKKGIETLNNADAQVSNMRALGYSLPSQKNFGFGTLCFTWRNVPNNTPLTFWYEGGENYPLFVVNRGQKTWGL